MRNVFKNLLALWGSPLFRCLIEERINENFSYWRAGFIGSALVRCAIERGHEIINLDCLTYAANLDSLASVATHPNYSFRQVNICDYNPVYATLKLYQPNAIVHLAAESHVDRSIDGPGTFMQTNILGTFNLLQATRAYLDKLPIVEQNKFRFHHVSTDEVYGDLDADDPAFSEETAYDPSSPYSASKAASDHLVRAWARTYGLPTLITNCSNNYGPYQFPEKFIPVTIFKALRGESIPIYGKGENIRDWLYVEDHADALLTVLENGAVGNTYNIGGNNELKNVDLANIILQAVADQTGRDIEDLLGLIEFVTDRPGHDHRYAVDASKLENELGWSPKMEGHRGFQETVKWYLENKKWWAPLIEDGVIGSRLGVAANAGNN